MDFQKVSDAIKKSSPEIKKLVFSAELGKKIQDTAFENNLDEDIALKLFDEVGYVILSLKSRTSFFNSLLEIGINKDTASTIAKEVESNIFSELDKIKKENKENEIKKPEEEKIEAETQEPQPPSEGVGGSFEQIILNQAKAMRPAQAPGNLPTGEQNQEQPKVIHNYIKENDPYREPLG